MKKFLMEDEKEEALEAIRLSTDEELQEALIEVMEVEDECRMLVGIGPEQSVPFFVNPFADFWSTGIRQEVERREHEYVDQGVSFVQEK